MKKQSSDQASQPARIVVVEESSDNIYSMRFILQSLGFRVASIAAKPGFLTEIQTFRPVAVIVDMLISQGLGLQVIKEIRASGLAPIKILALTADAVPFSPEEIKQAGADDVVVKPYTVTELQNILASYTAS